MIGYFDMALADEDLSQFRNNVRTLKFLDNFEARSSGLVSEELDARTRTALTSRNGIKKFSTTLREIMPQVDRVCWTTIENGKLKVERAGQVRDVLRVCRGAGISTPAKNCRMAEIAKGQVPVMLTELEKIAAPDMKFMSAICRSSFHVPVQVDGKRGTVNFWSRDFDGFPASSQKLLAELVQKSITK